MGRHTLAKGKVVLTILKELGEALNYHVETEYPVKKGENKQAIDIAWFIDNNDIKYPIMIFEIESYSANGSSANPMKIYSKPNYEFEKPLFFFHVFVDSGNDPAVIIDLEHQYGRNNYRVYEVKKGDINKLILDVISQHRRINQDINIHDLIELFTFEKEWEDVNITNILFHLEGLYKHKWSEILPVYAHLAQYIPLMNSEFIRFLDRKITENFVDNDFYEDYIAYHFSYGIHMAILTCIKGNNQYLSRLKWWQEDSSYMEKIGPYFGLSREYDDFIACYSGAYFGMLAVLLKEQPDGVKYILEQSIKILGKMTMYPDNIIFYNALWALHISATSDTCETEYNYIREYINQRGALNEYWIIEPPSALGEAYDEYKNHYNVFSCKFKYIPDRETFIREYVRSDISDIKNYKQDAVSLAIKMLSNPECWFERTERIESGGWSYSWGNRLINCLHFCNVNKE
ncbi:hypothetical protein [Paenibacillus sp. J2TS4]|uniref:hypothetical protein n=1 Tax=Paenibacillus sp. J2TS4 TaxID=2807194 RepID=UPI001B159FA0|nr:hypothetical protein [Paenibacillus sp. J2TS4]GIP35967.1 hypothetical protein J2TS4_51770 [Paenibacillus sp. J2TS4]